MIFIDADHVIVASFNVEKPVSFLEDNILQLEYDIFNEIGVPTTKVFTRYLLNCYNHFYFFPHFLPLYWLNCLWSGGYFISRTGWVEQNKCGVWGWSRCKKYKNIFAFSKFDSSIICIFGDKSNISSLDYILVWGPILFWSAKVSWRNYCDSSTEGISTAESANPFQLYPELLNWSNTRKLQWTDEPAEVGTASDPLWGLANFTLWFAILFCLDSSICLW